MHLANGVDEIGETLESKVLALHRHHDAVGADQPVERQQRQARRAIDEHEVVLALDGRERLLEPTLPARHADQLDFRARKLPVRSQHVIAALVGGHAGFGDGRGLEQHVVDGAGEPALVDAGAHRGVALRVEVDREHALADLRQTRCEVDGRRRLADAALLVGHAEHSGLLRRRRFGLRHVGLDGLVAGGLDHVGFLGGGGRNVGAARPSRG